MVNFEHHRRARLAVVWRMDSDMHHSFLCPSPSHRPHLSSVDVQCAVEQTGPIVFQPECATWQFPLSDEPQDERQEGRKGRTVSHREGGGSSSVLGLDDLCSGKATNNRQHAALHLALREAAGRTVTTELNSVDKSVEGGLVSEDRLGDGGLGLGEKGDNGDTRVSSNDGDDV